MGRPRQPFQHLTRVAVADIAVPQGGAAPDPVNLQRLTQTLKRQGQRDPVLVTPQRGKSSPAYRLVVGRRRLLAARELRWKELDAVVLDESFGDELAAVTALQAEDYDPWAVAEALQRLRLRCQWTQTQLGTAIGRNRDFVTGLLSINAIAPDVRALLNQATNGRRLSARHLRYVGRARPARQLQVAREILELGLSTKLLEQRFRRGTTRREFIKVRTLRQPGRARGPQTTKEWRRYYRKLSTDLRRVDEQELQELRRTAQALRQARQRQAVIRREARAKRAMLKRELRRATRQLTQRGAL